ncbi:hypothetical protein D3C77_557810 [compost metagenome]
MLEQVTRGEMQACLAGPADHLDRQDRVAAQFEEVILQTNARHIQNHTPQVCQLLFKRVAWCFIVLATLVQIRRW